MIAAIVGDIVGTILIGLCVAVLFLMNVRERR
jgi:hypothetical protein